MIEAQCFGCVDALSYQYHGDAYNGKEVAERYIASYKGMGQPTVRCISCGAHVRYDEMGDGRWRQVFVEGAISETEGE